MKRYEMADSMGYYMKMREHENGSYVQYEEVRNLIEHILDDCSLWETKPELLIEEWGE